MPGPDPELIDLADRLVAARDGGPRVENARGAALAATADCYTVQARVVERLGPVGAFKTARKPGEPQIMAPILARSVRRSPAVFEPGAVGRIGIELEVGFLVTAPLPDPAAPDFMDRARSCVAVVPVLEIVDSRWADLDGAGPLLRLADNQIGGGLVVGEARADWHGLDLEAVEARLELGTETVLDGPAAVPGGDAFETFCGFARMVGDHCGGLRPGQVVITGSLNGLPFVERGTAVRGRIEGLGEVEAAFPA